MRYRIDFHGKYKSQIVVGRKNLLAKLNEVDQGQIEDIRKLYNSGVSDSVYDRYIREA